jgi:2,4-dichlorophenol 6-monooxygenase
MTTVEHLTTDVLIVGSGPVGMISALLLDKAGLSSIIVECRSSLHTMPQAHVISTRTMEICRLVGIDDQVLRAAGTKPEDMTNIRWVDTLAGSDLGVYSLLDDAEDLQRMFSESPTPICNLSQNLFEQILHDHLSEQTSTNTHFDSRWLSYKKTPQGFTSEIQSPASIEPFKIRSKYIIGADGAGSRTRRAIGASMQGPDHLQGYVTIYFTANMRSLLKGRAALLYWVMDPAYQGIFIAHDIEGAWIYMKSVKEDVPLEQFDESFCRRNVCCCLSSLLDNQLKEKYVSMIHRFIIL